MSLGWRVLECLLLHFAATIVPGVCRLSLAIPFTCNSCVEEGGMDGMGGGAGGEEEEEEEEERVEVAL